MRTTRPLRLNGRGGRLTVPPLFPGLFSSPARFDHGPVRLGRSVDGLGLDIGASPPSATGACVRRWSSRVHSPVAPPPGSQPSRLPVGSRSRGYSSRSSPVVRLSGDPTPDGARRQAPCTASRRRYRRRYRRRCSRPRLNRRLGAPWDLGSGGWPCGGTGSTHVPTCRAKTISESRHACRVRSCRPMPRSHP